MRHAFACMVLHYPETIKAAARLRLRNACILPPLQLPMPATGSIGSARKRGSRTDELVILHASNLDWGECDSRPGRKSLKGNDLFIDALATFLAAAPCPVRVLMLDRGPDRHRARERLRDLGLDAYVQWQESQTPLGLAQMTRSVDLVIDQFAMGALGMITWEAMAVGRPVIVYAQPNAQRLIYDEDPPVLNARTAAQISDRLMEATDPDAAAELGLRAQAWVRARSNDRYLPRYLVYATLATGIEAFDLGWDADGVQQGRAVPAWRL
jgi:glycosyltransferase involved in cell wall biosynthesis